MIRFDSVSKQYAGTARPALNAINLEVLRGDFVFLVGASGSGKSSCLRLILKEDRPTKGKIHVLGQDLSTISNRKVPYFRRNIGVVFQDFRLLPNKTVFENVAFTLQVIGKSRGFIQEAVPDVLNMVGLTGKASRLPHELSGGEQQRVAIARAVVNKPQVLLADEPTGNLDPTTSAGIMAVLERINAGGTTVLMATHEAGIVDQMKRRVIELVNGQIIRDERHGGYGTAAIPTIREAVVGERIVAREQPAPAEQILLAEQLVAGDHIGSEHLIPLGDPVPAPVATTAYETPQHALAHTSPLSRFAPRSLSADAPAHDLEHTEPPTTSAPIPVTPAVDETGEHRVNAHFSTPPTQPTIRQRPVDGGHELPEQLSLAEKLGLRAPGERDDHSGEQNVGPTK